MSWTLSWPPRLVWVGLEPRILNSKVNRYVLEVVMRMSQAYGPSYLIGEGRHSATNCLLHHILGLAYPGLVSAGWSDTQP